MSDERRRDTAYIEDIAERAACRAVEKTVPAVIDATLTRLGIDTRDPIGVQRQMAYLKDAAARAADPDVQRDREWTRKTRVRCDTFQSAVVSNGARIGVTVIAALLLLGLIAYFGLPVKVPAAP